MEILPYMTTAKRGYTSKGDLCEVIQCILYKLKTGCQWHMIPTVAIFTGVVLHYKIILGKFRQWCKDGSWQKSWESLLGRNRDKIYLSSADLYGNHTVARRGGEEVGGAAHKAAQTTTPYLSLTVRAFRWLYRSQNPVSIMTCMRLELRLTKFSA